jgi:hypothetical protein
MRVLTLYQQDAAASRGKGQGQNLKVKTSPQRREGAKGRKGKA